MLRPNQTQMNFFSVLYDRIPEDHLLKRINSAVDFSFINDLVKDSYCESFGRPAKEPELMAKLCILERLYDLSDVRVIEESSYNLAYLWFLGLNPDDKLPDPSLLAKFRTQHLKEISLDDILSEIVRQCVEKGIIKGKTLSIDATHTEANCKKQVPERVMKHLAKKLFAGLKKDLNKEIPADVDTQIPNYKEIEDPKEAKRVMKEYLEKIISEAEPHAGKETKEVIQLIKEILSDEKFILQKGLRSLADMDARVGYKSKDDSFFGYKTEYIMTTDERIITAVDVHSGEYVDGTGFNSLLERTEGTGIKADTLTGDKAYFRKDILDKLKEKEIESVIPVNASTYRIDEEKFSYNKDSDQWFCRQGNCTIRKRRNVKQRNGKPFAYYTYTFDKKLCKECPYREECMGHAKGGKSFQISENIPAYYEESQRQKTPEFLEKYKKRAAEEWKNAEIKRFHGLARAKGWGLRSMVFQAKLTAIAVNLKRIANIIRDNNKKKGGGNSIFFFLLVDIRHFYEQMAIA